MSDTAEKRGPVYLAFFCLLFATFILTSCSPGSSSAGNKLLVFSGPTMGTSYSIKAVAPADSTNNLGAFKKQLDEDIKASLVALNQAMSTYIDDSELSRFNQQPVGEWVAISDALFEVLSISQKVSEVSEGAFDITLGPLINLWGFGPDKRSNAPGSDKIADVLAGIGYHFVELDTANQRARRTADINVSLSAVAKGYATDVVARLLESEGVTRYLVEIGGELKIRGNSPKNTLWRIGIEKPALGRGGVMQAVTGDNVAIATSGEYRNYYEENGVRISHTLDPTTGRPITHRLASVTVVTQEGGYADAYATALNVLGPERGYALATEQGLAAFFIIKESDQFSIKYTHEFEKYRVQ